MFLLINVYQQPTVGLSHRSVLKLRFFRLLCRADQTRWFMGFVSSVPSLCCANSCIFPSFSLTYGFNTCGVYQRQLILQFYHFFVECSSWVTSKCMITSKQIIKEKVLYMAQCNLATGKQCSSSLLPSPLFPSSTFSFTHY